MQHTANAYHMDFDRAATTHAAAASGPSTPSSTTSHPQFHVLHHQASQQPAFELDSRGSVVSSVGSVDSTFHVQAFSTFDHGFPTAGMEGFSFASQGMSDVASPTLGAAAASDAHHLLGGLPEVNVALPRGTVHTALHGNVTFVPYPQTVGEVQRFLAQTAARREEAARAGYFPGPRNTRAFIGQLPYNVTEMQLLWICAFFGGDVAQPQRITKTSESGEKIPTGAVHVMCDGYSYQVLSDMMHKRVLVDDTGLWFAQTPAQKANLDSYVAYLHTHKKARKPGRPYESVVIQVANSTFVPRRAMQFDATRR